MKAGIPIAEVNALRPLLYSHGERLIGGQHLNDLIPVLHKRKISYVKLAITGRHVAIIFHGTKKVCKAMVIIVQSVDDYFSVRQYLFCLILAAKSLSGEQVAHTCVHTLASLY